jgi:integrase
MPRGGKNISRFVVMAYYTGRRANVIYTAGFERCNDKPWIDLERGMLLPAEGAKITNKRNPPIYLPRQLLGHLRRWRKNGGEAPMEHGGHSVGRSVGQQMTKIAREIGLGVVTPHTLRHTAATHQMQAGTDMFVAGKYLGMTTRTLESVYAHHNPEMLIAARDAYGKVKK